MEKIQKLFNTSTFSHHAYGFESHGLTPADFEKYIDTERFSYVFSKEYDSFKVDDARHLKSLGIEKTNKESLFIISFTNINNEAQNTLLKLIEEPRPKTTFFFIFPNAGKLLPTVRSRMEIIHMNRVLDTTERKLDVKKFITMNLAERFALIKELNRKPKKSELDFEKMTKSDLQAFLDDIEIFFVKQKPSKKRNEILEIIIKSRKYMNAGSTSVKMITDMIAMYLYVD